MGSIDFATWSAIGSYGGLVCSLLAAVALAAFAVARRCGTPHQLVRAILVCLAGSIAALLPVWWLQYRLDTFGPGLGEAEVLFMLLWIVLLTWALPLGSVASFALLAERARPGLGWSRRQLAVRLPVWAALDDPARHVEPLGTGVPWATLLPLDQDDEPRPMLLTRRLVLVGREVDNDIVVADDRASRHHLEIHWDHDHPQLVDRGSMNGTFVNAQAVHARVPLRSGDIVALGNRHFRFEVLGSARARLSTESAPTAVLTHKMPGVGASQPPARPALARLVIVTTTGAQAGTRWHLRPPLTSIGRDPDCHVSLPDSSVSRMHAQLVAQDDGVYISDLQSSNGTYVNGERLSAPRRIRPGDQLRVGEVTLRCELEAAATPSALAPAAATTALARRPLSVTRPPAAAAITPPNGTRGYVPEATDNERAHIGPPRMHAVLDAAARDAEAR